MKMFRRPAKATVPKEGTTLDRRTRHQAVEEADRLAAEGSHRAAIDLLTETNRRGPSFEVERRLVEIRHDAFASLESEGLDAWPPPFDAPPADAEGIPQTTGPELTVERMRNGILGQGALLVRELLPRERAEELARGIQAAFDAAESFEAGETDSETRSWYAPFHPPTGTKVGGRRFVRQGGGVWTADSPRMLFSVIEMLHDVGFIAIVNEYLGEEAAISVDKSTLRIVPPDSGTNWHQDGAFLGQGIRTCNLWLALSPCGEDAPSLDVVPRRFDRVVETGSGGAAFDWSVGSGTIEDVAGPAGVVRPCFETGDALLFDDLFLHRTGVGEGMTKPRLAIESWFFAASTYPSGQVPLLI